MYPSTFGQLLLGHLELYFHVLKIWIVFQWPLPWLSHASFMLSEHHSLLSRAPYMLIQAPSRLSVILIFQQLSFSVCCIVVCFLQKGEQLKRKPFRTSNYFTYNRGV